MVVALRAVRVLLPWEVFKTNTPALAKQTGLPLGALFVGVGMPRKLFNLTPPVSGAFQAIFAVVAVAGQAVAQLLRVVVDGRGNAGEAGGGGCGPGKDEGQGQQGMEPAGLAGFGFKLAASA